jgi:hypothetical protein
VTGRPLQSEGLPADTPCMVKDRYYRVEFYGADTRFTCELDAEFPSAGAARDAAAAELFHTGADHALVVGYPSLAAQRV